MIGFILILVGMAIRIVALKQSKIKNYWRILPQELCTSGLYSFCKHPMYLGTLITMFGINWLIAGLKVAICLEYVIYLYVADRADREEQLMVSIYGERYLEYSKRVYMFIPFIC